jgi:1,4-dihydroxy-2-naphthoate octaprenyltransferase/chlorophyll synthase
LLDGVFIVLMNDWADRDIDALKRRLLPRAGSPKTIPDRILPAPALLAAGLAAGLSAAITSLVAAHWLDRPLLGWAGFACLGVFVAYSLPPLRLNYRGGGELLEALGVGLLLPWTNAYAQSGRVAGRELLVLSGYVVFSLASAVASGLSDEVSDRAGGKRTLVTLAGNAAARRVTEWLMAVGAGSWLLSALLAPASLVKVALVAAALWVLAGLRELSRTGASATTHAYPEQGAYKRRLHRMIWGPGLLVAGAALASGLARGG